MKPRAILSVLAALTLVAALPLSAQQAMGEPVATNQRSWAEAMLTAARLRLKTVKAFARLLIFALL